MPSSNTNLDQFALVVNLLNLNVFSNNISTIVLLLFLTAISRSFYLNTPLSTSVIPIYVLVNEGIYTSLFVFNQPNLRVLLDVAKISRIFVLVSINYRLLSFASEEVVDSRLYVFRLLLLLNKQYKYFVLLS